jgi:hypothetical protein
MHRRGTRRNPHIDRGPYRLDKKFEVFARMTNAPNKDYYGVTSE